MDLHLNVTSQKSKYILYTYIIIYLYYIHIIIIHIIIEYIYKYNIYIYPETISKLLRFCGFTLIGLV